MAKPTRSRPRSSRSVSPSASPSTISISFDRSMPRQIPFVIRCMRASVAFFFVSSSDENRRTARTALAGLATAARGPVDGAAHHGGERLGPVAELVEEEEVLRARRIGHAPVERRLVLLEEPLRRADELLTDRLILVVRQDCDGPEDPDRAPGDGERGAHDLRVVLLRDEAAPRLHEPAVVDVLSAAERLARPGAELALEEVAER